MSNTSIIEKSTSPDGIKWNTINWIAIEKYVKTMQQRIYHAVILGHKRKVRELQRILVHSKAALLISIRRVTQVNRGKRTAGIDKIVIRTPDERWNLFTEMEVMKIELHKPKPSYRTYIKKKNGKLRPLSIPTIKDRIYQFIIKLALEPQWEGRFETCSYGFRPERGCHDAIEKIGTCTRKGAKRWIFEGDFKGCFDNLNQEYILNKIADFPFKNLIKKWLKAGYVDKEVFKETEIGSGQGSIISPLLANIALMGMESILGIKYRAQYKNGVYAGHTNETAYTLSFYADDFVVVCKTKEQAEDIHIKLQTYLKERGLELSEEKTRIVNISEGFNFLGFNIRMFPTWFGEILLIRPSKETMKKSKEKIRQIFKECHGRNADFLVRKLNPLIRGLAGYWSPFNSKQAFKEIDEYIWVKLVKFLKRMHHNKGIKWIFKRYFKTDKTGQSKSQWIFTDPDTKNQLQRMAWIPIVRHPLIKHCATPFNEKLNEYFELRHEREFRRNTVGSRQKLATKQKYKCPLCKQSITELQEKLTVQLKVAEEDGGRFSYSNMELVHNNCSKFWTKWRHLNDDAKDDNSRKRCEAEIKRLRLAGII